MDVPVMSTRRCRGGSLGIAIIALAATLIAASGIAADNGTAAAPDVAVKAALLYNFAKFAEWPALPSGARLLICIVGDDAIAAAVVETVRGQNISGHALDVSRPQDTGSWHVCQLLFIADAETRRSAGALGGIRTLPVLTVSDGKGFSQTAGIIELYVQDERMRFAINVDAAERSGLHLSSRLLGLAKIIRNGHVQ
jgi:YfiR/HmsC-like